MILCCTVCDTPVVFLWQCITFILWQYLPQDSVIQYVIFLIFLWQSVWYYCYIPVIFFVVACGISCGKPSNVQNKNHVMIVQYFVVFFGMFYHRILCCTVCNTPAVFLWQCVVSLKHFCGTTGFCCLVCNTPVVFQIYQMYISSYLNRVYAELVLFPC